MGCSCREKVNLSQSKRYVFLEGEGAHRTSIEWGDHSPDRRGHGGKATATFTSSASSFVAAGIAFKVKHHTEANDSHFSLGGGFHHADQVFLDKYVSAAEYV